MKRPTIAEVVDELSKIDTTIIDELNKIDTDRSSPIEQAYSHTAGTGDIFIFDLPFFCFCLQVVPFLLLCRHIQKS